LAKPEREQHTSPIAKRERDMAFNREASSRLGDSHKGALRFGLSGKRRVAWGGRLLEKRSAVVQVEI